MTANTTPISVSVDPLNVLTMEVPPLNDDLLDRIKRGREERTRILDGSLLEQHSELKPYALSHVSMHFDNEDDIIKCVRLLQWSDERMREKTDPVILWGWQESYRERDEVYFSVVWYSKDFFEQRKGSFGDASHRSYFSIFGMSPKDLEVRHEICD